jgi:hypothetical protein
MTKKELEALVLSLQKRIEDLETRPLLTQPPYIPLPQHPFQPFSPGVNWY